MMEFGSHVKVAPSTQLPANTKPETNKRQRLFPKWPPRTRPKRRHVYNTRRRREAEFLLVNRSGYLFISLLGLLFIVGGSALTWYGTRSEVKDLLLIGPGSVVIGFVFVVVGIVFVARFFYYRCYADRFVLGSEEGAPPEMVPPPADDVLYDHEMTNVQQVIIPPVGYHNVNDITNDDRSVVVVVAVPECTWRVSSYSSPKKTAQTEHDQPAKDIGKDTTGKQCQMRDDSGPNNKQYSRLDSGYGGVF